MPFAPRGGKFAAMKQSAQVSCSRNTGAIDLTLVEGRVIRVSEDTLLCSLAHEIEVVEL